MDAPFESRSVAELGCPQQPPYPGWPTQGLALVLSSDRAKSYDSLPGPVHPAA